jgi:hypothetical protein
MQRLIVRWKMSYHWKCQIPLWGNEIVYANRNIGINGLMEMDSLFYGESEKAFFKIKEMQDCRKEIKPLYPSNLVERLSTTKKKKEQIIKRENEIRVIGVDVALMASKRFDNDNTSIVLMRLLPDGEEYIRQVVYLESCSGENTEELAVKIKRLFYDFECDYCVLDAGGNLLPFGMVTYQ